LLATLEGLAAHWPDLATVTVSHHLEELPATTTHALLLRAGAAVSCGNVADALTSATVSDTFGVDVRVNRVDGRWHAIRRRG